MPELKPGDEVTIFIDPITEETPEGEAVLLKLLMVDLQGTAAGLLAGPFPGGRLPGGPLYQEEGRAMTEEIELEITPSGTAATWWWSEEADQILSALGSPAPGFEGVNDNPWCG